MIDSADGDANKGRRALASIDRRGHEKATEREGGREKARRGWQEDRSDVEKQQLKAEDEVNSKSMNEEASATEGMNEGRDEGEKEG